MDLQRPFSLLPCRVVPTEVWAIDYDVKTTEIYGLLYMEPLSGEKWLSVTEAYILRWHQNAIQDSTGKYWLKDSHAIRTPLHRWCRDNGYYPYFLDSEITFPELIDRYF